MALAALAATLPTFAALAVAAAGGTRRNGGPFGKTERCLVAALACPASAVPDRPAAVLSGAALLVLGGSLVTATLRVLAARRELAA
jgi:CDP-diacylglycerol--glycerol-3-phosphate 3-phosphatidyltransferase